MEWKIFLFSEGRGTVFRVRNSVDNCRSSRAKYLPDFAKSRGKTAEFCGKISKRLVMMSLEVIVWFLISELVKSCYLSRAKGG